MMQLRKAIGHPYLFPGIEPEPFEMGEHLSKFKINHFLIIIIMFS
jgi:hypothetical protein